MHVLRLAAVILSATLYLPSRLYGQSVALPPAAVEGRVTNSVTGDAIGGATIRLTPLRYVSGSGARPESETTSQPDGGFHFDNVPAGEYFIRLERPGFSTTAGTTRTRFLTLRAGQLLNDLTVQLTPYSTMSGKILDEQGRPVSAARVRALAESLVRGRTAIQQSSTTETNDAGAFILPQLRPGSYYVIAEPAKDDDPVHSPEGDLVPTFFPRALELEGASRIDVTPGASPSDVVIYLRRAATYTARGKLGDTLQKATNLRLSIGPRDIAPSPAMMKPVPLDKSGAFAATGLTSGAYTLTLLGRLEDSGRSRRAQALVRQDFEVGAADVSGLVLNATPALTLQGQVSVDGTQTTVPLNRVRVIARPLDDLYQPAPTVAVVQPDGSFQLANLDPATYMFNLSVGTPGVYVKSLSLNQQDILHKPVDLNQTGGGKLEPVLRVGASEVDGTIQSNSIAATEQQSTVVLCPEELPADGSQVEFASSRQNAFSFTNLAPGRYVLFAVENVDPNLWQNPEFLRQISNQGKAVELVENQRQQVELSSIPSEIVDQTAAGLGLAVQ